MHARARARVYLCTGMCEHVNVHTCKTLLRTAAVACARAQAEHAEWAGNAGFLRQCARAEHRKHLRHLPEKLQNGGASHGPQSIGTTRIARPIAIRSAVVKKKFKKKS